MMFSQGIGPVKYRPKEHQRDSAISILNGDNYVPTLFLFRVSAAQKQALLNDSATMYHVIQSNESAGR